MVVRHLQVYYCLVVFVYFDYHIVPVNDVYYVYDLGVVSGYV